MMSYVSFLLLLVFAARKYLRYQHSSQLISGLGANGALTEMLFRFFSILLAIFSFAAIFPLRNLRLILSSDRANPVG